MCQPNMREFYRTTLPSLCVRIDLDTDSRIGPGKIQLLENIRVCGSISAAGRAMDMSYKRAWALVDEINRICWQAAVERQVGGKSAARTAAALSSRRLASLSSHVIGKSKTP
jgi:molybdate transport repressor ModE-like protein